MVWGLIPAKSKCFAFSSVPATGQGPPILNCGFKYTKKKQFQPFTEVELHVGEYVELRKAGGRPVPEEVISESKRLNVLLPQIIEQCSCREDIVLWFHRQVHSTLQKYCSGVATMEQKALTRILMKACSGLPLDKREKAVADLGGFRRFDRTPLLTGPSTKQVLMTG